jgi:hypothetical protein
MIASSSATITLTTGSQRRFITGIRVAAVAVLAVASGEAFAQGGPPLVTDDPETPGNGHWEINLATTGERTVGRSSFAAPDADLNYGWGEHIQLKVDVPLNVVHETGKPWKTGLGAPDIGVKWRFIDIEDSGFSMSTYPQYTRNWLSSTARRGISPPGKQFLLPIEVATVVHGYSLDAEAGATFVQYGTTQWILGGIVAHTCAQGVECLVEVHRIQAPSDSQTLLNLGLHWKLNESAFVLAAVGREFGQQSDDQQRLLFYLGVQLLN